MILVPSNPQQTIPAADGIPFSTMFYLILHPHLVPIYPQSTPIHIDLTNIFKVGLPAGIHVIPCRVDVEANAGELASSARVGASVHNEQIHQYPKHHLHSH